MTIKVPGYGTLTGTPVAILQLMQAARITDDLGGDALIKEITSTAWRTMGIGLHVTGETYAERAESLLHEMADNEMIIIEEEN